MKHLVRSSDMMESQQLIAELEELETRLRKLAKRNNEKAAAEGAGDRALIHSGMSHGYEQSAELLADTIKAAREWVEW